MEKNVALAHGQNNKGTDFHHKSQRSGMENPKDIGRWINYAELKGRKKHILHISYSSVTLLCVCSYPEASENYTDTANSQMKQGPTQSGFHLPQDSSRHVE